MLPNQRRAKPGIIRHSSEEDSGSTTPEPSSFSSDKPVEEAGGSSTRVRRSSSSGNDGGYATSFSSDQPGGKDGGYSTPPNLSVSSSGPVEANSSPVISRRLSLRRSASLIIAPSSSPLKDDPVMQKKLRVLAGPKPDNDPGREAVTQSQDEREGGWAVLGMGSHGFATDKVDPGPNKQPRSNVTYLKTPQERAGYLVKFINGRMMFTQNSNGETIPVHENPVELDQIPKERTLLLSDLYHAKIVELLGAVGTSAGVDAETARKAKEAAGKIAVISSQNLLKDQSLLTEAKGLIGKGANKKAVTDVKVGIVNEEQAWGAGRRIFVMDGDGRFYVGQSVNAQFHHSSFLAGNAASAAGEIVVNQGEIKMISNVSGHYKPGAAFLWQAVRQLHLQGANVDNVVVDVYGAGRIRARDFLQNFSPLAEPGSPHHLSFNPQEVTALRDFIGRQK